MSKKRRPNAGTHLAAAYPKSGATAVIHSNCISIWLNTKSSN